MTTTEFKRQIREAGLEVRKQRRLEAFDVSSNGTELFSVSFAELYPLTDVNELLNKHLRLEYIPPLG